jgi:hypothetical protein
MGAFFSFTCGHFGTRGGFGLQSGKPGNQDLYIGVKPGDRKSDSPLMCLPFYEGAKDDPAAAFLVEQERTSEPAFRRKVVSYRKDQITRHYGWASDKWMTPDFAFTIYTPFGSIGNPHASSSEELRSQLLPAVLAELVVDNSTGKESKTFIFAVNFPDGGARLLDGESVWVTRKGFAWRQDYGGMAQLIDPAASEEDEDRAVAVAQQLSHFMRWTPDQGLAEDVPHGLGSCPGFRFEVPAGETRTLRISLGAFISSVVTTRLEGKYFYTRFLGNLEDVLSTALDLFEVKQWICQAVDQALLASGLSPDQQFLIAHSTRSYYGSTQLLDVGGQPFWIVNEGEYCMMNTLDLSVDHVFWELDQNPWVVRNLLDNFVRYYSYVDQVKVPRDANTPSEYDLAPGGISFCHDMGIHNNFSPFGQSSYELPDLPGCFSHMTQEQLCNWILIAASYVARTGDAAWAKKNEPTIRACLHSMNARRGNEEGDWMRFDSSRCGTGSEITTYDSLDESLGQARNNLYIAVKRWAAYVGLRLLSSMGADDGTIGHEAGHEIEHFPARLRELTKKNPVLPAVFEEGNPGATSRILAAAEALVYPWYWSMCEQSQARMHGGYGAGISQAADLIDLLQTHSRLLLEDSEHRNQFPDGGLRLSSTSNNSWMSKIALFQHIAREVFHLDKDPAIADLFAKADAAHVKWETEGASAYWAMSDQMVNGVAQGSKYYPRCITTALWLNGRNAR